jgi:hypothetical protein
LWWRFVKKHIGDGIVVDDHCGERRTDSIVFRHLGALAFDGEYHYVDRTRGVIEFDPVIRNRS